MEINDYSKRLSQARDQYQQSADNLKKTYDRDLNNLQETHATQRENQKKSYLNDKLKTEDAFVTQQQNSIVDNKSAIENLENRYKNYLETEKSKNIQEQNDQKEKLTLKLDAVKDAYGRSVDNQTKARIEELNRVEKRQERRDQEHIQTTQASLKELENQSSLGAKTMRDQFNNDRKRMANQAESEKNLIVANANERYNDARAKQLIQVDELNKNKMSELNTLKENSDAQKRILTQQKDAQNLTMRENFENTMGNIQNRNVYEQEKSARENSAQARDLNRQFQKDLDALAAKNRSITGSGSVENRSQQAQERLQSRLDSSTRSLNDEIDNLKQLSNIEKEKMSRDFHDTLTDQKRNNNEQKANIEKEASTAVEQITSQTRKEKEEQRESFTNEFKRSSGQSELALFNQKDRYEDRLKTQRVDFEDTLRKNQESNSEVYYKLRDEHKEEKKRLIDQNSRLTRNKVEGVKDDFRDKIYGTEKSYEQRLEAKVLENKNQKEYYEQRLENLETKFTKELQEQKVLFEETKIADELASTRLENMKERAFEKRMLDLKTEFDKRLGSEKSQNNIMTNKLTERYETRIDQMMKDHFKELKLKEIEYKNNYERLVRMSEMRETAMKQQYESKLEKMKQSSMAAYEKGTKHSSMLG
jgi:hypothetical protein